MSSASVVINNNRISNINTGILLLLGIDKDDTEEKIMPMLNKICHCRIFGNESSSFDDSLIDIKGDLLIVSQFTLMADCKKGRRPSFSSAAEPKYAKHLVGQFIKSAQTFPIGHICTGEFGENMQVNLTNDGPVTITLDSNQLGF